MRKAIIVDEDGTIANIDRRFQQAFEVSADKSAAFWDAFFQGEWVKLDRPVGFSQVVLNAYKNAGYVVIYLSGRRNNIKKATSDWNRRWGYPKGLVILRPKGIRTKKFKRAAVRALKRKYDIEAAFDNERGMVRMFREEGIPEVVCIRTNSARSWKSVLRGLHLPVTVDKWLGYRGSRELPSWRHAVHWMRTHPEYRMRNTLKPIRKCMHCGFVSYTKVSSCPKCRASM